MAPFTKIEKKRANEKLVWDVPAPKDKKPRQWSDFMTDHKREDTFTSSCERPGPSDNLAHRKYLISKPKPKYQRLRLICKPPKHHKLIIRPNAPNGQVLQAVWY